MLEVETLFNRINEKLEVCKQFAVSDMQSEHYLYSILINELEIQEIDFSRLDIDEIRHFIESIFEMISDEDDNGIISLDPHHGFTLSSMIQYKIWSFESLPKLRGKSSFQFL